MVGGSDAEHDSQPPAPAGQGGDRGAEREVDGGRLEALAAGSGDPGGRLAAADPQQVQASHEVMDRELRHRVQGERECGAISLHRRHQAPSAGRDPEASSRAPREQATLDRPLHSERRELGPAEPEQHEGPQAQRIVTHADQAERQRAHAGAEAVTQLATADRGLHRDGVFDPDRALIHALHKSYLGGVGRVEFAAEVTVKCTPERAFDYFADHRHVAAVLDGVTRWKPIGVKTRGVGARYDVEMNAFGFPLKSVLRLNRWRRPDEIGWISESGLIKQEGGFTFQDLAPRTGSAVRIELRIAYEPPASFIGAAVAGRVDWMVRRRLKRALEHIRDVLEAG